MVQHLILKLILGITVCISQIIFYCAEFEPQPLTFELLQLNSRLANNIKCFNVGLSSSEKKEFFVVDQQNIGGSRIVPDDTSKAVSLNLKTLDSMTDSICSPVRLIKIDVEGHEHDVLLGAKEVIAKYQPIIIFEQHESDFIGNSTKSIDLIRSYNYSKFALLKNLLLRHVCSLMP